MDEKAHRYEHLPIPTYEEAITSRPSSSHSRTGPQEISDDAERQGLLRHDSATQDARSQGNYLPPTVESARSSVDSIDRLGTHGEAEVRREMQQMDIDDSGSANSANRSLLASHFKRFTSLTNSLPSISLPSFNRFLPSIPWPRIDWQAIEYNKVVIIGRLFGIMLIVGLLYVLIASNVLTLGRNSSMGQMFDPESVRIYVQKGIEEHGKMREYLEHITEYPHMAGTEGNYVLGEWIAEMFKAADLEDVSMERFDVYLNYPRKEGRRVAIVEPADKAWEAQLEEDIEETYVFHGHAKAGDVTGPLVYANFGSPDDFRHLADQGISVKDAVVLVRYYGTQGDRALKVKAAELAGAAGCIIYSDPAQDGSTQGPEFPNGRFMPVDGVQRGAVSLMSWVVGDVLSPGWASTPGSAKRISPEESEGLNRIPSIPISWKDARHLLESLVGHGLQVDGEWAGAPNTIYWTGDQNSPKVNLKNEQDEELRQPIYNVLGKLSGWEQSNKKIIVGNHRDAWCKGASDPGSGTAIMLEVVRQFGELKKRGWAPLRTIEFASWDGEEYNLIGSTEHVENREEELRRDGVAYINVDVGVNGIDFHASASPVFERPLRRVLERIQDPLTKKPLAQVWDDHKTGLEGLGAGSDYVAFQDIVGTSSIDMSFEGQHYPYHSCYDNFEWMDKFGDPTWEYHTAMAQIWTLLILELADHALLPLDMEAYARSVSSYIDQLESDVTRLTHALPSGDKNRLIDLGPLRSASHFFNRQAGTFNEFDQAWHAFVHSARGYETSVLGIQRMDRNNRLANFESDMLDLSEGGGLPNRTQFKHVIFGPQKWSGYDEAYFPGIRDYIEVGDWVNAQQEVQKVADMLESAAKKLTLVA